jgi:ERCC4-type nuclease
VLNRSQVHPHSIEGALVSIAAMWRLPVFHSADAVLRFLAEQGRETGETVLVGYDRKPKRLATRRLIVLQGLPGVGPALAQRLSPQLGSVERVVTAGAAELAIVRGIGSKRVARIREIVST